MAYTQASLSTLQQSLADRHDSGVLPTSSTVLAFWTRLLNRGQEYCADRMRLEKSTSLTTTSGSVALPDDFVIVNRVYNDDEEEYTQVDKDAKINQEDLAYWITGNHADGFTFNVPNDDTFTIYYSFKPVPLSSSSDVCAIPDPEAVVAYAYSMLRKSETDPIEDADSAMAECDARIDEMISASDINNNFQGFSWE